MILNFATELIPMYKRNSHIRIYINACAFSKGVKDNLMKEPAFVDCN